MKYSLVKKYLESGDVYYGVVGQNPPAAIETLFSALVVPKEIDKSALKEAILDREALMPTAIGGGFALPHPRKPLESAYIQPFLALAYADYPIEWAALDDKKVSTFILIISTSQEEHLAFLGELSGLLHDQRFLEYLAERPTKRELLAYFDTLNPVATR